MPRAIAVSSCLVHQGRGLERLTRRLADQLPSGQPAQLVVDQREQLAGRLRLPTAEGLQDARDFAFTAIDRNLLDVGRWMGSSSIGITSGSHTTPCWTRDGRTISPIISGRVPRGDGPPFLMGGHRRVGTESSEPGLAGCTAQGSESAGTTVGIVRSRRLWHDGAEDQNATAKPVRGVQFPPLAPSRFRPGLAGRHLALLDRRAAERRQRLQFGTARFGRIDRSS